MLAKKGVPSAVIWTVRRWCLDCTAGPEDSSTSEVQRLHKVQRLHNFCPCNCWVFAAPSKSERQLSAVSAECCRTRGSNHLPCREAPARTATGEQDMPLWTWHALGCSTGTTSVWDQLPRSTQPGQPSVGKHSEHSERSGVNKPTTQWTSPVPRVSYIRSHLRATEISATISAHAALEKTSPSHRQCGTENRYKRHNLNDRWKRLGLVSWAAAPCVWTIRAPTTNLLTYWRMQRTLGCCAKQFHFHIKDHHRMCTKNVALTSTLNTFFDVQNKIIVIQARRTIRTYQCSTLWFYVEFKTRQMIDLCTTAARTMHGVTVSVFPTHEARSCRRNQLRQLLCWKFMFPWWQKLRLSITVSCSSLQDHKNCDYAHYHAHAIKNISFYTVTPMSSGSVSWFSQSSFTRLSQLRTIPTCNHSSLFLILVFNPRDLNNNNNNNNNASITIAQNKLSAVAPTAVQTNMSSGTREIIKRISRYWTISMEQPKFHSLADFCSITKTSAAWPKILLTTENCAPYFNKSVGLVNVVTNSLQRHTENLNTISSIHYWFNMQEVQAVTHSIT